MKNLLKLLVGVHFGHDHCYTWSGCIPTARNLAVLPASFRFGGVAPGHPLIVGVSTIVVIQASDKQQAVIMVNTGNQTIKITCISP